eukprot:scaffold133009_cov33-Tisochrysis_lutea.AAC.1
MDDDELQRIYTWVDEVPLSRPKRNIARDFADGVLTAEIVHHYFPRLVEIHNYPAANSYSQKMYNWNTLNAKVFKKMGWQLRAEELEAIVNCTPMAVEKMLKQLQARLAKFGQRKSEGGGEPMQQQHRAAPPTGDYTRATPRTAAPAPPPRRQPNQHAAPASGIAQMGLGGSGVQELLAEKDHNIQELRETVDILEIKIQKLEQLVRLKDSKIATLQGKLQQYEM